MLIFSAKIAIKFENRLTIQHFRLTEHVLLVVFLQESKGIIYSPLSFHSLGVMPVRALKVRKKEVSLAKPDST